VVRFLKLFTDLPLAEIAKLEKLKDAEINEAKKVLAFEATKMVHGEAAAQKAADTAKATFEGGGKGEDLPTIKSSTATPTVADIICELKFAASKGEAKRLIEQGGVYVNGRPIAAITATVSASDADNTGALRISVGKKKHGLVRF
jgi:tyrosyl-tRNA synthetase